MSRGQVWNSWEPGAPCSERILGLMPSDSSQSPPILSRRGPCRGCDDGGDNGGLPITSPL